MEKIPFFLNEDSIALQTGNWKDLMPIIGKSKVGVSFYGDLFAALEQPYLFDMTM